MKNKCPQCKKEINKLFVVVLQDNYYTLRDDGEYHNEENGEWHKSEFHCPHCEFLMFRSDVQAREFLGIKD